MYRYNRTQRTVPWIIVSVFLAGAILTAAGIITGGLLLGILGAVTVVTAGLSGAILPHFGLSAPVSYNAEFTGMTGGDTSEEEDAGSPADRSGDE